MTPAKNTRPCAYHHIYSGGAHHGTESNRLYQAADPGCKGNRIAPTVYADRSFSFVTKTPPTPTLILKALGIEKGSGVPNKDKVATITKAQVKEIAERKMPDLTANTIEAAMSQVAGTCRSMGIVVVD